MPRFISFLILILVLGMIASAQSTAPPAPATDDAAQLRQEVEQLRKALATVEQRLAAQEKLNQSNSKLLESSSSTELTTDVKDLEKRVSETERSTTLDRVKFTGDYRFEVHSIWGNVPAHYDGLAMQNLMVKTLFVTTPAAQGGLGVPFDPAMLSLPQSQFVGMLNGAVQNNYSAYQNFTNNLTYNQLNQAAQGFKQMGMFSPFMNYLAGAPGVYVPGYSDDTKMLYTNRLRLKFNAKVADNVSFEGRLSMYKVFGDSTAVQVFNGQPNSLVMDGTNAGVPNSDILRVERAYLSWNHIGGSKFYFSVGRRPSTDGPPMNYRNDELRGGTPPGTLFDFQYDGMTLGYRINDKMVWRVCYGIGYDASFGNGNLLAPPQDRLKSMHLMGAVLDVLDTGKTFIQATYAHAFNVTDGFNGLIAFSQNPLTGDPVPQAVMRFTPSANLGSINLAGVTVTRRQGPVDLYLSGNYSGTRPNGMTGPFGGLMTDPFGTPVDRDGYMALAGVRYSFPWKDEATKLGFEVNHGTRYWFNFAQAQDDIIAPKTNTRGEVYEVFLTHRISERFLFKTDFMRYNYRYSGSGWHIGEPKSLDSAVAPVLGFPTYKNASMLTGSLIARF